MKLFSHNFFLCCLLTTWWITFAKASGSEDDLPISVAEGRRRFAGTGTPNPISEGTFLPPSAATSRPTAPRGSPAPAETEATPSSSSAPAAERPPLPAELPIPSFLAAARTRLNKTEPTSTSNSSSQDEDLPDLNADHLRYIYENCVSEVDCPCCDKPMMRVQYASKLALPADVLAQSLAQSWGPKSDNWALSIWHCCNYQDSQNKRCGAEMRFGSTFLRCPRRGCDRDFCDLHDLPKHEQEASGRGSGECGCGPQCKSSQHVEKNFAYVENSIRTEVVDIQQKDEAFRMLQDVRAMLNELRVSRPGDCQKALTTLWIQCHPHRTREWRGLKAVGLEAVFSDLKVMKQVLLQYPGMPAFAETLKIKTQSRFLESPRLGEGDLD